MKFSYKLKPKGEIWKLVPFSKSTAQTIYPNIYFPKAWYKNLISKTPKPMYSALLEHEKHHIQRQKELGLIRFGFRYLFDSEFRFKEEVTAYKIQINFLKKYKEKFPIEKIAKHLSGPMYLWAASYEKVLKALR